MTAPHDPYQTQPLSPITAALVRPVQLPAGAIAALAGVPALLLVALLAAWAWAREPAPQAQPLLPSPTLGVARLAAERGPAGLPRAVVAYDAPGGAVVGALEPGRAYRVAARAGLDWVQLDVAAAGAAANLVWVVASDVPEGAALAGLADLATPAPTATPRLIYVAAPAPAPAPAAAAAPAAPEPTAAYLLAPPTQAPRPVVVVSYPTATPCRIADLGLGLQPCNGIVP